MVIRIGFLGPKSLDGFGKSLGVRIGAGDEFDVGQSSEWNIDRMAVIPSTRRTDNTDPVLAGRFYRAWSIRAWLNRAWSIRAWLFGRRAHGRAGRRKACKQPGGHKAGLKSTAG